MSLSSRTKLVMSGGIVSAVACAGLAALAQAPPVSAPVLPAWKAQAQPAVSAPAVKAKPTPPTAAPAAAPAAPASAPIQTGSTQVQAALQTVEQLQKAGVKRCLQTAQVAGQATMAGASQYAAVSTWNNKQPDNRFTVSMIGQQFAAGQNSLPHGVSGIVAVPTAEGRCDATTMQVIPTSDACAAVQAQILAKGKALGNLAGVPLLQNAANAQVMLLPTSGNGCVVVALSTAYTE